jgi:hypothetical protein
MSNTTVVNTTQSTLFRPPQDQCAPTGGPTCQPGCRQAQALVAQRECCLLSERQNCQIAPALTHKSHATQYSPVCAHEGSVPFCTFMKCAQRVTPSYNHCFACQLSLLVAPSVDSSRIGVTPGCCTKSQGLETQHTAGIPCMLVECGTVAQLRRDMSPYCCFRCRFPSKAAPFYLHQRT